MVYQKEQKDIQRSTIHYTKKKSSNTNPTKNRDELRCFGRLSSSCFTSDTRRVAVVTFYICITRAEFPE
jgi:hypothetical protein